MLDRLGLAIRLRDPWEAIDLGFILLRRHWGSVMAAWLVLVLPLSAALLVLFRNHLWVPPLLIWWLIPALDRVVLHVLSRATFGEVPALRETLRSFPRLCRHGLLASLLWRRFSPQRSFILPVWQLEEQPGNGFRRRCDVLLRRARPQAILLTLVCFLFHGVVFASALAALSLFTPSGAEFGVMDAVFGSGSDRLPWLDVLLSALPILSISLLEPFYAAGGFALYLNRRVELEGWDLEVAFRKTAARILKAAGRSLALLVFALFLGTALPARTPPPEPKEALAEVLRQPEFQSRQKKKGLHWKDQGKKPETKAPTLPPGLLDLLKLLGVLAKWAIITAAAAALAYILWRNRAHLARRLRITSREELPDILFGMDIRPEALPAGLDGVAARLWAEGRIREALALLYRGALAQLVHGHRTPISKGATEGDCLRKAREVMPVAAADYFGRLTRVWLRVAYADLDPGPGTEALCAEWPRHFREPREAVRP